MSTAHARFLGRAGQAGISLVVTLLLLLAVTLIGIAAINNNNLQVKMAVNNAESNLSFQSAESAIQLAEKWLAQQTTRPAALDTACTSSPCDTAAPVWKDGVYTPVLPPATPTNYSYLTLSWWTASTSPARNYVTNYTDANTVALTSTRTLPSGVVVYQTPLYVIEELRSLNSELGNDGTPEYTMWYYRITALGYGAQSQSATLVQTIYAKRF
jgi:type IV pilus assembly protein PilX